MAHLLRLPLAPSVPQLDAADPAAMMPAVPVRYLRVVLTARCNLSCSFCHMEGDPGVDGIRGGLPPKILVEMLLAAAEAGVGKIKFLGGEPMLRADLPSILRPVRQQFPGLDLSVITAGAIDEARLGACYEAGLSRCNVSIHGWGPEAFSARTRTTNPRLHDLRQRFLEAAVRAGRPLKLNYVYTGPDDEGDLAELLCWAAGKPLVVNVLDDLGQPHLGAASVFEAIVRLRGEPTARVVEPDPFSLPTLHLHFADGLEVEIKDQQLGAQGAYLACASCPKKSSCREGILALRLTHSGVLRPCMDREDLGVPLLPVLEQQGRPGLTGLLRRFTAS